MESDGQTTIIEAPGTSKCKNIIEENAANSDSVLPSESVSKNPIDDELKNPIDDEPKNPIDDEPKLTCSCGKVYLKRKRYSVYDVDFCSMTCLRPFKAIEDEKRKPRSNSSTNINMNYGGGPTVA